MRAAHLAMFNRAYEYEYQKLCDAGVPAHIAREKAADKAWDQYERYCEDKRDEEALGG